MAQKQSRENNYNFLSLHQNEAAQTQNQNTSLRDDRNYPSKRECTFADKQELESNRVLKSSARIVNSSSHIVVGSDVFEDGRGTTEKRHASYLEPHGDIRHIVKQPSPRWQTKWEVDMRPEQRKQDKPFIISSIPIMNKPSLPATQLSSNQKSKVRNKRKIRIPRFYNWAKSPVSEKEKEKEKFERTSVKSTEVDQLKMLHKTCARSDNACTQTRRLWNIQDKKKSKFLSDEAYLKDVNMKETVPDTKVTGRRRGCTRIKVLPANRCF